MGTSSSSPTPSQLQLTPIQSVSANESLPKAQRSPVLLAFLRPPDSTQTLDDSSFYRIVVVTPQGIEQFCLVTGVSATQKYTERPERRINAAIRMNIPPFGPGILTCDDLGAFKFIDLLTLSIRTTFLQSKTGSKVYIETDEISCIFALEGTKFAVGHKNGLVEMWIFGGNGADVTFNADLKWEMPGVSRLAVANRLKWLLSGHESAYVNREGRFFTLESCEIRIYSLENPEESTETRGKSGELPGFTGTCFDLAVADADNFAIALSSIANRVFIWRLGSNRLVFTFSLPNLLHSPAIAASFSALSTPSKGLILSFGMSDGSVVVSRLAIAENQRLLWTPLKTIRQKTGEKCENREISWVEYDEKVDLLLIGDRKSHVMLIYGFIAAVPDTQASLSPVTTAGTDSKSSSDSTKEAKVTDTAFSRYLASRQSSFSTLAYEEMLLAVTSEWQQLSPEQRERYASSLPD